MHLVSIDKKTAEHVATLDEMDAEIKRDYRIDAQKKAIDIFYEELRTQYRVSVATEAQ